MLLRKVRKMLGNVMDWLAKYFMQMTPGQQLGCLLAGGNNLPCSSHLAHPDTLYNFPVYTVALGCQGRDLNANGAFWDRVWFIFPRITFIIHPGLR